MLRVSTYIIISLQTFPINRKNLICKELARLLKGINAYVNLIPYNEVKTKSYRSTKHDEAESFFQVLYNQGINATVRMEHGNDISAACGQLRAQKMQEKREV